MTAASLGGRELTARQIELADAALTIIARDGMAALSFRSVAAEAGCSLGAVQKAFPRKERMLAAAFARLREQSVALPPDAPGRPTLRSWLVSLILNILPLDEHRRSAQRQCEAFAHGAASDSTIRAAVSESDAQLRGLLASLVLRAREEREIPAHIDPEATAWAVLALTQGVATQLSYDTLPTNELRMRLDGAVAALLAAPAADADTAPHN
ncbi:TetR/AcrR family transcriptional regulator [Microbacterium sp. SORGH_AS_0862]|uniref:TetR/AcrR family transcriptional regulator n=1 Tax=Microbacterium sp. SORGH_AS_0862 TaxID=3041789 RepID=UPI0027941C85|nr:TetR/AcrR family transcriptional regulator [Microbacterium sp. SORGH_AS_0862]MDQ1205269.1 AcrR family transcriptional regulator [Microbacterium sp. SORGH_AS_0862]